MSEMNCARIHLGEQLLVLVIDVHLFDSYSSVYLHLTSISLAIYSYAVAYLHTLI